MDYFLVKLNNTITDLNQSIDDFKPEMEAYTSITALKQIKIVFLNIKSNISSENFDNKILPEIYAICHHLSDQWPHDTMLCEQILDICQSYKNSFIK